MNPATPILSTRARYAIALTASLGLIMAILDATIVNVALVPLSKAFATDLSTIQWVVTGYFLAQAAVIPIAGYFGNIFGLKRVFMLCLVLFTAGSVLCALAQDENSLILFRVVQGIGGGALFPLGQAIALGAFATQDRAAATAIVAIPVLLAPVFGPTVGGWLIDNFDWQAIFLVNLPVGILALTLGWFILPADRPVQRRAGTGFDFIGLALVTLGVLAVVYAFTLVGQSQPGTQTPLNPRGDLYGWSYWLVWALLGVGAAILAIFAVYELRVSKDPVLDLRLFRQYEFSVASVVSWINAVVVFGSLFLLPVFFQQVHQPNLSALDAGLALMPQGIASALAVAIGGRFYNRIGVRPLVTAGAILLIISSWLLTQITPTTDGWEIMPALILRGFGFGLTLLPVQTMALEIITGSALPKASSLFNVTRQIFSSIGIAVTISLFVQRTSTHAADLAAQAQAQLPPGVTPDPNNPLVQQAIKRIASQAGTAGITDVFFYVMLGMFVLLAVSFVLPSRQTLAKRRAAHAEHDHVPAIAVE